MVILYCSSRTRTVAESLEIGKKNNLNIPPYSEKKDTISEDNLESLQKDFFDKRKRYTMRRNIVYSLVTLLVSIFVFISIFLLLSPPLSLVTRYCQKNF